MGKKKKDDGKSEKTKKVVKKPSNVIEFKLKQNEKTHEQIVVSEVKVWLSKRTGMPDFLREQVELYALQKERVRRAMDIMERLGIPDSRITQAVKLQQELLDKLRQMAVDYEVNMEDELESLNNVMKAVGCYEP